MPNSRVGSDESVCPGKRVLYDHRVIFGLFAWLLPIVLKAPFKLIILINQKDGTYFGE